MKTSGGRQGEAKPREGGSGRQNRAREMNGEGRRAVGGKGGKTE